MIPEVHRLNANLQVDICGSFRRGAAFSRDIDLLIGATEEEDWSSFTVFMTLGSLRPISQTRQARGASWIHRNNRRFTQGHRFDISRVPRLPSSLLHRLCSIRPLGSDESCATRPRVVPQRQSLVRLCVVHSSRSFALARRKQTSCTSSGSRTMNQSSAPPASTLSF